MSLVDLFIGPAETPAAALKLEKGLKVLRLAKVRPQRRRDVKLGVGDLPEKKIADAHLAARADEKIGIGNLLGGDASRDDFFIDVTHCQFTSANLTRDALHHGDDVVSAAVTQRQEHRHAPVLARDALDVLERRQDAGRQPASVADS